MFASLNYSGDHHPYAAIPGQPDLAPETESASAPAHTNGDTQKDQAATQESQTLNGEPLPEPEPVPHSPEEFNASLRELAQALVLKEQQIEYLIHSLPGIGSSERDQEKRMRELQEELKAVEEERERAEVEREKMVEGLSNVLVGGKRVP